MNFCTAGLIAISKFSVSFKLREVVVYLDAILLHTHTQDYHVVFIWGNLVKF